MNGHTTFVCIEGIAPVLLEPDPQSKRLTDLLFGEEFITQSECEGLVFGATAADAVEGFVSREFLAPKSGHPTHRIRRTFIHVYHAPHLVTASGKILPMNALVDLTGRSAAMRYRNGSTGSLVVELRTGGWVTAQAVTPIGQFEKDIGAIARSFIGAVYLPGGKTWLGCDGPGFIQSVLAAYGNKVPRQFSQQVYFFERENHATNAPIGFSQLPSVVYSETSCGFLLGGEVIAARNESMHIDVTSLAEFSRDTEDPTASVRVFPLRL
jgi:cell wall-associated NlpC family hydrolase